MPYLGTIMLKKRFSSGGYNVRTFRWSAICRIVLLAVLLMVYLCWVVEGHPYVSERLVCLSQPLPDKPDFLMYRLLTGLTEAINTCFWLHKDLLRISLWEKPEVWEIIYLTWPAKYCIIGILNHAIKLLLVISLSPLPPPGRGFFSYISCTARQKTPR